MGDTWPFQPQHCLILLSKATTKTMFVFPPSAILCNLSIKVSQTELQASANHHESLRSRKQSKLQGVKLRSSYNSSAKTHSRISLSKPLHEVDSTRCINATQHTGGDRGFRVQISFLQIMLLIIIRTGMW